MAFLILVVAFVAAIGGAFMLGASLWDKKLSGFAVIWEVLAAALLTFALLN